MKKYNKLVRSKILRYLDSKGVKYTSHIAGPEEYEEKTAEKLIEEVTELIQNPCAEEAADVYDILDAFIKLKGLRPADIDMMRLEKNQEKGDFLSPVILDECESK